MISDRIFDTWRLCTKVHNYLKTIFSGLNSWEHPNNASKEWGLKRKQKLESCPRKICSQQMAQIVENTDWKVMPSICKLMGKSIN